MHHKRIFEDGVENLHPSYFVNDRYKKLYKNILDENTIKKDQVMHHSNEYQVGIPLSNQILYEHLDSSSNNVSRRRT